MAWLGMPSDLQIEDEVNDETCDWQQWVLAIIEEFREVSITGGSLPWEQLAEGLALCAEIVGNTKQLATRTGFSKQLLSSWQNHKQTPSFERMLELCYVLDISPLLLMTNKREALKGALLTSERYRKPRYRVLSLRPVNREQALALIEAVLDGREAPMGVRQLERILGLGARTLIYHFPQECPLISTQYQAYRAEVARKRMEQVCREIHHTTLKLYTEGTNPSAQRVASRLSEPGLMRTREGLTAWHTALRELGLESGNKERAAGSN